MEFMSATIISFLSDKHLKEVREIFFESSSRKIFEDEKAREAFFEKYLGYYLLRFPELSFVAIEDNRVLGYVVASPVSDDEGLYILQPHLKQFKSYFKQFPAHLHINCHHSTRGQGIGTRLIDALVERLKERDINGLHIMTGVNSENRSFYRKLGFNFETAEEFQGAAILFMGKAIEVNSL